MYVSRTVQILVVFVSQRETCIGGGSWFVHVHSMYVCM